MHRSSAASPPAHRRRSRVVVGAAALALLAGGVTATTVASASGSTPNGAAAEAQGQTRDVVANLFEWNWPSVARECTKVLGPSGYGAVQVAPPQDSLRRTSLGNGSDTVLHPWWEVYQPVDYRLTSRMGSPAQFRAMVRTCRSAGVHVIVDAVINHMSGQGSLSYGGVHYSKYRYPGLYWPRNFHSYPRDCPVPPSAGTTDREGSIADFNDYQQVWNCELVGLSDLRTGTNYVRAHLAGYLNKLLRIGVSGFRVDAAKHIPLQDLAAIESRLHDTVDGTRPYLALEVGTGSPGRISPWAYLPLGSPLGFDYASQIQSAFKSYNSPPNDGNIGDLKIFGTRSGLLPSNRELVFIENHDSERNGSTLNYKDPNNTIANEFMLAWPHGRPEVYASFAWTDPNASPPARKNGHVTDTVCDGTTWVCVDRYTGVRHMVRFHNYVGSAPVRNWFDDRINLIAFSRGHRGFFSTNNEASAKTVTVHTGLAGGRYCDIIHGALSHNRCTGPTVWVRSDGTARITVGSYDSVAFTAADRVH